MQAWAGRVHLSGGLGGRRGPPESRFLGAVMSVTIGKALRLGTQASNDISCHFQTVSRGWRRKRQNQERGRTGHSAFAVCLLGTYCVPGFERGACSLVSSVLVCFPPLTRTPCIAGSWSSGDTLPAYLPSQGSPATSSAEHSTRFCQLLLPGIYGEGPGALCLALLGCREPTLGSMCLAGKQILGGGSAAGAGLWGQTAPGSAPAPLLCSCNLEQDSQPSNLTLSVCEMGQQQRLLPGCSGDLAPWYRDPPSREIWLWKQHF